MKEIFKIFLFLVFSNYSLANNSDSLILITRREFEKGEKEVELVKDSMIRKKNGILKVGRCKTFRDDLTNDNFQKFDYVGDIDKNFTYKVIRQTLYNGEPCFLINTNVCETYELLGIPHVFGLIIINLNESETTDRKELIEIWKIGKDKIYKIKNVPLDKILDFVKLRLYQGKFILLKDSRGRYWKIHY